MKLFFASDKGALCLIGFILAAMLVVASTSGAEQGTEPAPTQPTANAAVETGDATAAPSAPATSAPAVRIKYTIQDLNLRAAPGAGQPKVTVLPRNSRVELLGEAQDVDGGTWVKVRMDTYEGWVNQKFLRD